jgi:hypothetical protein
MNKLLLNFVSHCFTPLIYIKKVQIMNQYENLILAKGKVITPEVETCDLPPSVYNGKVSEAKSVA